jgi:hypothetical protein
MALDLATQVPRSPFDELEGFCWLPRLIDKKRAHDAGTDGEYSPYPCPGDKGFLKAFGVEAGPLGDVIKGGADDAAVTAWVVANAKDASAATKAAYRAQLIGPHTNLVFALFTRYLAYKNRAAIARHGVDRSKLDSIPKVLAAEEGHPVPER